MEVSLKDICIVIFSRDRNDRLLKSLEYWADFDVQVLVLHNTSRPLNSDKFSPRINYQISTESFVTRCGIAAKLLIGKFAIIASDDELYLPSVLILMAKELTDKPGIVSIGAQSVALSKYGFKYYLSPVYSVMYSYKNLYKETNKRLNQHYFSERAHHFNGAMYRMGRINDVKQLLLLLAKLEGVSTPYISQITAELYWTILGPSEYLNEIFWIRNWIEPHIQANDWQRSLYFNYWFFNKEYEYEVKSWVNLIQDIQVIKDSNIDLFPVLKQIAENDKLVEIREYRKHNFLFKFKKTRLVKLLRYLISKTRKIPKNEFTFKQLEAQSIKVNAQEITKAIAFLSNR